MTIEEFINIPLEIRHELRFFLSKIEKPAIFDIGACDAIDSIRYSNLFPEAKIYCFEPLKSNFLACELNIRKFKKINIELFNLALSNIDGFSTFYVSSGRPENIPSTDNWDYGNKSSSLLEPDDYINSNFRWLHFNETIEVETITLNNFCTQKNISVIDFIHLDVQGAEMLVLEGADKILPSTRLIWLEAERVSLYKNQALNNELENFLKNLGFVKIKDTVGKVSGDQLYINKNLYSGFVFFPTNFLSKVLFKLVYLMRH
jgi:FkbM family methyltransferase